MAEIIEFTQKEDDDECLYRIAVYRDKINKGEVVARVESSKHIPREVLLAHLDQLQWKFKNKEASSDNPDGRITLQINHYENTIDFIENPAIKKDKAYIAELKKQLEEIVKTLEQIESER